MSTVFTGAPPETLMLIERDVPAAAAPLPAAIAVVTTEGVDAEHIAFHVRGSDAFRRRAARLGLLDLPGDDPKAIHDFARRYELTSRYAPDGTVRPLMAVVCRGWDADWAVDPDLDEAQARAARAVMRVLSGGPA